MSINRIRGDGGVIIDSKSFLELPKAPTKQTTDVIRSGMFRYNQEWKAFEGVLDFEDGTVSYRRFANLDNNGKLLTSQLPDSITSGLQFVGTYSPIEDDIDPPLTQSPLPAPAESIKGDYYVVRGIMDAAQAHFEANSPATSPVTFTPTNPTGQGNWIQIMYYVDSNPIVAGSKLVSYAFARIVTASIPSTGHTGLVNLAQDTDLTNAFASGSPMNQTALSDGDWIIITDTKNIRLRQSRASIAAASVLYDNTVMIANNREFVKNSSTVQTMLDNIAVEGLRRDGDSMYDDGTKGAGRFGITYGTASAPALTFNNKAFDPTTNPGNDPAKWSDPNTGIFHPQDDTIGFTTNGTERVRVTNGALVLYYSNTTPATTPTIRFDNATNTNVGISGDSNIISLSSMNKVQAEFRNGITVLHGDLTVDGATTLSGGLNVTNITASGNLNVKGNTVLGDANTDTVTINGVSTFAANTVFNAASNRFKNLNLMESGIFTLESTANQSTIQLLSADLKVSMGNYADVTILDNGTIRTRFNRYGIQLPVLATIDNSVGVDGMIAYSNTERTSMQKVQGQWVPIGSGSVRTDPFTASAWVLSGDYYTLTVTASNIVTAEIQELVSTGVYTRVEVDSVTFNGTNVVFSIPSSPDVRFAGRTLVTLR